MTYMSQSMGWSMMIITKLLYIDRLYHQTTVTFDATLEMLCLLLTTVIVLSNGVVEGDATNSEISNLTIAINKLLTQFTHKCPVAEQSNSRDAITDLMQLVLTKQLLSVDSSSSSQPNTCDTEGIQQAIEVLNNTMSMMADQFISLKDAVSKQKGDRSDEKQDSLFTSCEAILRQWPNNPSGYYSIADSNGSVHHVYCHMEGLCNLGGGWMRIANLNMTKECVCPNNLRLYSQKGVCACGRPTTSSGSCVGTFFSSSSIKYSQVCGKVIGYQVGFTDGTAQRSTNIKSDINTYYTDGVSLTHGNPRQHIWTLMSGSWDRNNKYSRCPCGHVYDPAPTFVGSDYYCESGYQNNSTPVHKKVYTSDRLWDGKDCGSSETACCQRTLIPWFYKSIGYYTTDNIEMRICCNEGTNDEDVAVEQYEFYVK